MKKYFHRDGNLRASLWKFTSAAMGAYPHCVPRMRLKIKKKKMTK
jgi:hypothetical protein